MKRFYKNWPMHNIVAHPLMQILEWIGLVSMADKLHDATLPPNVELTGGAPGGNNEEPLPERRPVERFVGGDDK